MDLPGSASFLFPLLSSEAREILHAGFPVIPDAPVVMNELFRLQEESFRESMIVF